MVTTVGQDDAQESHIVERIYEAVMDQRLAPGAKLSEAALCQAFGVGRMRIRRSLLILASREMVELQPNRGAYVAQPTSDQAHEVFEARLVTEPPLAKLAAQRIKRAEIKALESHLRKEHAAHKAGNRREAIRLSGQFHAALAQVANNTVLLRIVKDLITRSSIIIAMYGDTGFGNCRDDEHSVIVTALRDGKAELVEDLMRAHLIHIRDHLHPGRRALQTQDLVALFGSPQRLGPAAGRRFKRG